ncbi:MAG: cell wall hydrolase [Firmicutes bacterium]|nr:cell wall hydrolase [Bacillota bacterium]
MKRRLSVLSVCLVIALTAALSLPLTASSAVSSNASLDAFASVTIDGEVFAAGQTRIIDDTTCVPFRAFVNAMTGGEADVWWDGDAKIAYAEYEGAVISAAIGEHYIAANGRYLWCGTETYLKDGTTYVAVRPLAAAFGAEVTWQSEGRRVIVSARGNMIESGDTYYDAIDLFWLSRIISAEAQGEPLSGKLAVGAVIYNRIASDDYPDTVYGVIFDETGGVQFTPAATGTIYSDPTEESVIAAKLCMDGYICDERILFFCAASIAAVSWAGQNRTYLYTIEGHAFFA